MKKWRPYIETRHVSLLNFQRVKNTLETNGYTRSNAMIMITWNDIMQDSCENYMLKKKVLTLMRYFIRLLDLLLYG